MIRWKEIEEYVPKVERLSEEDEKLLEEAGIDELAKKHGPYNREMVAAILRVAKEDDALLRKMKD